VLKPNGPNQRPLYGYADPWCGMEGRGPRRTDNVENFFDYRNVRARRLRKLGLISDGELSKHRCIGLRCTINGPEINKLIVVRRFFFYGQFIPVTRTTARVLPFGRV